MAQHGYLREYDEDRDPRDRERVERAARDRDHRHGDRGFMFDDQNRSERIGDRARDRFREDDRQWRRTHEDDWSRSPRNFRSNQDDHYRSWRDRHMQALDRDYEDYCREREQQFHSDFDNWRRNRGQQQRGPTDEVLELTESRPDEMELENEPDGVADATLGTNNSENTASGRR